MLEVVATFGASSTGDIDNKVGEVKSPAAEGGREIKKVSVVVVVVVAAVGVGV